MKLQELFTDESKWTRDAMARDETQHEVDPQNPNAVCWCLIGAVIKCYPSSHFHSHQPAIMCKIQDYLEHYYKHRSILRFNDSVATFRAIQNLCKELDI